MKNLKKLIAVVLTFALVFSAMAVGFAATTPFTDVKDDAPYASAVARLYALNITNGNTDGTYGVDQPVTRAMMTVFVNRLSGYRNLAEAAKNDAPAFKDVSKNYWAVGDINLAAKLGLTHGVGNGMFDPEGKVTYAQALGFMLNVLGYKNLSWPYGVLAKAQDLGLAVVSDIGLNDVINRGQLALIMDKALDTPMVTYDQNGNEVAGKNLITKLATPTEYIVLATADQTNIAAGNVKLYDVSAKQEVEKSAGNLDFAKYVGKDVNVYYTSKGVPVLITENTNNVKEYSSAKIDTTTGVVYDTSTTPETNTNISVASNMTIMYNGYLTSWSALKSNLPGSVDVKLIDNNNDGKYEYAIITGYDYPAMFITANVADNAKYLATDSGNYTLVKDDGTAYHYTVTGDAAKLSDIKANDVVYYGKQYDENGNQVGIYLYVVRNTVTGTVSATYDDSGNYITIAGKDYKNLTGQTFSAGDQVTIALDKDGNAFRLISGTTTVTSNYAVVLNSAYTSSKLTAKIELFTADGKDTVYAWDTSNTAAVHSDEAIGKLVRFDINSDNTVVSNVYDDVYKPSDVTIINDPFTSGKYDATSYALQTSSGSSKYYYLNSNTVIFVKDANGNYSVAKLSDITSSDSYKINAIAYDTYNNVKAIVFDNPAFVSSNTTTTNVFVTKQYLVKATNGNFNRITGLVNGQTQTFDTINDSVLTVQGVVYALTVDNVTNKVVGATPLNSKGVTFLKIDTVNMTLDVKNDSGATEHYLLTPGYQIVKANTDGTYSVKYASDLVENASITIYIDSTGKVVAIKF